MNAHYTPIDLAAQRLLHDLAKQAENLRSEIECAEGHLEKLRADYESLRDIAATLTVEGRSPFPPLDDGAG